MVLKVAFVTISGVVLPAIDPAGGVRAQHSFSCGGNAATGQGAMMLPAMRTHAQQTLGLQGMTSRGGVTPLPTVLTKCYTRVCLGSTDISNLPPHLEGFADDFFHSHPTHSVGNVEVHSGHVRCR